jgi:hypothetical protein
MCVCVREMFLSKVQNNTHSLISKKSVFIYQRRRMCHLIWKEPQKTSKVCRKIEWQHPISNKWLVYLDQTFKRPPSRSANPTFSVCARHLHTCFIHNSSFAYSSKAYSHRIRHFSPTHNSRLAAFEIWDDRSKIKQ